MEMECFWATGHKGVRTLAGNGNVDIDLSDGHLIVDAAVTAHGAGDILLNIDDGNATINADVSSTTGNITVNADSILQNANITTTGAGDIDLNTDVALVMVPSARPAC